MQIVMQIDGGQRHELEAMIKDLEEENKYVEHLQNLIQQKCFDINVSSVCFFL